jgi:dipeptidase
LFYDIKHCVFGHFGAFASANFLFLTAVRFFQLAKSYGNNGLPINFYKMKKTRIIILSAALWLAGTLGVLACTNFLVTKKASADGSTMITYAADSHSLFGEVYYRPAADYPEGSMLDIYEWDTGKWLGKIKQVRHTYSVMGNMNEWQVAIGETTYGGRGELVDTSAIMDYGSLIYVTLQRARTAREAIKIMAKLVEEYGYYSSGESFSISDPNEVWVLEIISKGPDYIPAKEAKKKKPKMVETRGAVWVALRIPDGCISGHANQARINKIFLNDTTNCYYAKDVITFAREKSYFNGKDEEFSFCDAYAPLTYGAIRHCEGRVWAGFNKANKGLMGQYFDYIYKGDVSKRMPLWIEPDHKLTVQDVMDMMRDHFEGTILDMNKGISGGAYPRPYEWRPMTWTLVDGKDTTEYNHERAISTQQTGFSFVTQSRSWLPREIGGINWFGFDDTYSTVYVPLYSANTNVPNSFKEGVGSMTEFTWNSAFWVFNWVANFAYSRYSDMIVDIKKVQKELEDGFVANTKQVDDKALALYKADPKKAVEYLTDYSCSQGDMVTKRWEKLGQYLLVKYMDGNVKKEKDGKFLTNGTEKAQCVQPGHPAYPESWYRQIVKERGDVIKMKKLPGEK